MGEIRRQHYLPFVYLKHFRCDPDISTREKAMILRDNGTTITEAKVAKQCYSSWCYRRSNTKESESAFESFESDWDEVISRARRGLDESALLFSQMILYHFRNLSIRILAPQMDRFEAVQGAIGAFIEQKILKLQRGVKFTDDSKHVTEFPWKVRIVAFPEKMLLTSDNPSVMTICSRSQVDYGPFFLPFSPSELFVAFDPEKYQFEENCRPTISDGFLANAYVSAQGTRHVYYSNRMNPDLRSDLWRFIDRNRVMETGRGSIDGHRFVPCHVAYPADTGQRFSFLTERRPS